MSVAQQTCVWSPLQTAPGLVYVERIDNAHTAYEKILHGISVREPLPQLAVDQHSGDTYSGLLANYLGLLILVPELAAVLKAVVGADIQFVPIEVPGSDAGRYEIANIITSVSCVDRERSRYTTFEEDEDDDIFEIEKLVLKPLPSDTPDIFRIEELAMIYLVSAKLKQRLCDASPSPGTFLAIEDFQI